jgi:hypothetical protein
LNPAGEKVATLALPVSTGKAAVNRVGKIPDSWLELADQDDQEKEFFSKIDFLVKSEVKKTPEVRLKLPYSLTVEAGKKVLHVPSDLMDRDNICDYIIVVCASALSIQIIYDREERVYPDVPDQMEMVFRGILVGLKDEKYPFAPINSKTDHPIQVGRNICNIERRFIVANMLEQPPQKILHWIPKYMGTDSSKKFLHTVYSCISLHEDRRKDEDAKLRLEAWRHAFDSLLREYLYSFVLTKLTEVPVEIFKRFDDVWSTYSCRRTVTINSKKKKGKSSTKVVTYHPKKPSSFVGILESERDIVERIYDAPWKLIDQIKLNWFDIINKCGWTTMFEQLTKITKQMNKNYSFCRRIISRRIKQNFSAIPPKADFQSWYRTLPEIVKKANHKIVVSYFSPIDFLDPQFIPDIGTTKVNFTNISKGYFDDIPGLKKAWESYIKYFSLEVQYDQAKIQSEGPGPPQKGVSFEPKLDHQQSHIAIDDISSDDESQKREEFPCLDDHRKSTLKRQASKATSVVADRTRNRLRLK